MLDASNGWSEMTEARGNDKALVDSMLAGEAEAFDLFFDAILQLRVVNEVVLIDPGDFMAGAYVSPAAVFAAPPGF